MGRGLPLSKKWIKNSFLLSTIMTFCYTFNSKNLARCGGLHLDVKHRKICFCGMSQLPLWAQSRLPRNGPLALNQRSLLPSFLREVATS